MSLSDSERKLREADNSATDAVRIQSRIGAVKYLTRAVSDQADEIKRLKSDVGQLRSLR
ncbi:MAG TPA: hypothetical protein VFQ26_09175 [Nitrospiraceae bacterium]|nr:hypothetical protein [Nitrospiraceae bacterium]